ncbi:MAG: histidine kinase [Lachnospiraceae bacterium]|nr:histidine kinase [Lachnospiraceae bacterium]
MMGPRALTNKIKEHMGVQSRLTLVFVVTMLFVLAVNFNIYFFMNSEFERGNSVYMSNVTADALSEDLKLMHGSLEEYLNTKSSDAMGDYYKYQQEYLSKLDETVKLSGAGETGVLAENIEELSKSYIRYADEAVAAKRGRIVERYREMYVDAERVLGYINSYIYLLNSRFFSANSETHEGIRGSFNDLEILSITMLVMVSVLNIVFIVLITGNIMSPVKEREMMMASHLKETELKYLQAQINPHFLFNTLNAGAQLSMMEGADRTGEYLQNVAAFYRYRIRKGNEDTLLSDEIQLVDNYVYILNVRFSGEISYEKDVDDSLTATPVPVMILQPIVENAFNHGIRDIGRQGEIRLSVSGEGNELVVSIKDNGRGMDPEVIEKMLSGNPEEVSESSDGNGVGLKNVISRLELYYGKSGLLNIRSDGKDKGTEVFIYIPRPEEKDV